MAQPAVSLPMIDYHDNVLSLSHVKDLLAKIEEFITVPTARQEIQTASQHLSEAMVGLMVEELRQAEKEEPDGNHSS